MFIGFGRPRRLRRASAIARLGFAPRQRACPRSRSLEARERAALVEGRGHVHVEQGLAERRTRRPDGSHVPGLSRHHLGPWQELNRDAKALCRRSAGHTWQSPPQARARRRAGIDSRDLLSAMWTCSSGWPSLDQRPGLALHMPQLLRNGRIHAPARPLRLSVASLGETRPTGARVASQRHSHAGETAEAQCRAHSFPKNWPM